MGSISDAQFQNDLLRQKSISDAIAALLRAVADSTAKAPPDGSVVLPASVIRFDSAAVCGQPSGSNALLTINVPRGLARRDLFIRLPRINDPSSAAGGVPAILTFLNTGGIVGTLPIDTTGNTRPVAIIGVPAGQHPVSYSDDLGVPNLNKYDGNAAVGNYPTVSRSTVAVTVKDSAGAFQTIYIPATLRLELDVNQITLAWVTATAGTNTGNEELLGYLGCLTAPLI